MRISCPEQMLGDRSFAEKLDIVRRLGFDGIDARSDTLRNSENLELVRKSGLPVASVFSQVRTPSLLDAAATDRAAAVETVLERIGVAVSAGAENMILVPVFGPPRLSLAVDDAAMHRIESALLLVALKEIGSRLGNLPLDVVLEPLNRKETHFLTDPVEAAQICRTVDEPRIATMVDTYHCFQEGIDPATCIAEMPDQLRLVHVSDSSRGLPGEGEVDFAAVLAALHRVTYTGWLGYECRKIETDDDLAALETSLQWLRGLDTGRTGSEGGNA